jgi:hypothetical protein
MESLSISLKSSAEEQLNLIRDSSRPKVQALAFAIS